MTLKLSKAELATMYKVQHVDPAVSVDDRPQYNIAPGETIVAITEGEHGRTMGSYKWGLMPASVEDFSKCGKYFNARSDELTNKWPWKLAFPMRRCIVPASGFYEWRKEGEGKKEVRLPFYVRMRDDAVMGFAGIWLPWRRRGSSDPWVLSCSVVTTDANELMRTIPHRRMPAIMSQEFIEQWLNPDNVEPEPLLQLLQPYDPGEMELYRVSTMVNASGRDRKTGMSRKIDDPRCIEPDTLILPVEDACTVNSA
jgi:putative SOS response-associated peptidase YedK